MEIIETHAHLDFKNFDNDRSEMLNRARQAGVKAFINVSLHPDEADKTLKLLDDHSDIYAAVGIHPHASGSYGDRINSAMDQLRLLTQHDRVVALGEMGLDYYRDRSPRPVQRRVFAAQLDLAHDLQYPVVIHSREADDDVLQQLAAKEPLRVVFHCFSGNEDVARQCDERGYYIGVGGVLTYPKSDRLRKIVGQYPKERVVLETDCPFLSPQARRGRRNEPAYLTWIAEALGELWGVSAQEAAAVTAANARRFFDLPPNPKSQGGQDGTDR